MNIAMTTRVGVLLCAVLISGAMLAQGEEDAIRMATVQPGGTARSNGMANAFGALGADPASIGINPAGFGLYRTSSLSLTPSLEVNDASSKHYEGTSADTRTRFYFSNLALVLNNPAKSGSDWSSGTYGVVFDRNQSFNWGTQAVSGSVPSSILQSFANEAQGTPTTSIVSDFPFTAGLAWDAYGINDVYPLDANGDTIRNQYASAIPFGSNTRQTHSVDTRGATSNTAFFYSGNYMDRLYLGASVGVVGHRFKRRTTHNEIAVDQNLDLKDLTYSENLSTIGNGFIVKVGGLVRITERFRAGASFHSPQWLTLNDAYSSELKTNFRTPDQAGNFSYSATSPDGTFAYKLVTPWRAVASAAYIAGANGMVSLDYEYTDMRRMRFRPANRLEDLYDFNFENDRIKSVFRAVHSVRVGTEWRSGNWYYRLGWGIVPDAYVSTDPRHSKALKTYAAGVGYRGEHVTVDLGLNFAMRETRFFQYSPDLVDATRSDLSTYRSLVTVSFRP